ncbi:MULTISPECIES: hypothetical protein [unclassified Acinetobacter]|uniref:hypothetical protein n=1 Tax=unclassified Acinetobacter TaxID=196816 RepID=UPI00244A2F5E|nr:MULTISPECIES: hypothetical protein [unclassified Acinetobacter]MDH0032026.1 hypothetical protein [Acinetobacter sp. GD04021]MDH0887682.1 hypothetical protein [Acinetobacter sp. GD03873]MDH1084030.1 hypothetical protein [Acinetobacter sp. GD03983]MDH2191043.1 hypothetical protein [Acinetobacter sp. GD03645]MDH2204542.1 hypothetical protein [Acinetobacter sp. GD03647]
MGNRWHAEQNNNMRPDVIPMPCPWCGLDAVVVDTALVVGEHINTWSAKASCHECGATAPDDFITSFPDHSLFEKYKCVDWEDEREVVNFAVQIWNIRK